MYDQAEKLRRLAIAANTHNRGARVIAITSGKGGVGKTNFTVNLALALSHLGKRVCILDADFGMANIDVIMGVSPRYSIMHFLNNQCHFADIVTKGPEGIQFIAGGSGITHLANLDDHQMQPIIDEMEQLDDLADIFLIDTGAGINANVLRFVMSADEVIIVTTPEPTAITDAYAMMKAYNQNEGYIPVKLVVNAAMDYKEAQAVYDKLAGVADKFLGLTVINLGYIYEDVNLVKAVRKQKPLLLSYPNSSAAKCIENIANRILDGSLPDKPNSFKCFLHKLLPNSW